MASVAPLLYEVSPETWRRFTGTKERSLAALASSFRRGGTDASAEVVAVAELDGRLAGALAAFPVGEARRRYWKGLAAALSHTPLWRWPVSVALFAREMAAGPIPPQDALYVDALVTAPDARRRGVARALLEAAETRARELGFARIALDTNLKNEPARALYERVGFVPQGQRSPGRGLAGAVLYVKELTIIPRAP